MRPIVGECAVALPVGGVTCPDSSGFAPRPAGGAIARARPGGGKWLASSQELMGIRTCSATIKIAFRLLAILSHAATCSSHTCGCNRAPSLSAGMSRARRMLFLHHAMNLILCNSSYIYADSRIPRTPPSTDAPHRVDRNTESRTCKQSHSCACRLRLVYTDVIAEDMCRLH